MVVLLTSHREGQCRAIVGSYNNDPGQPLMCGLPTVLARSGQPSSWCRDHYNQFTVPPRPPAAPRAFTFKRKPTSCLLSTVERQTPPLAALSS
jgi:hypothetical protein